MITSLALVDYIFTSSAALLRERDAWYIYLESAQIERIQVGTPLRSTPAIAHDVAHDSFSCSDIRVLDRHVSETGDVTLRVSQNCIKAKCCENMEIDNDNKEMMFAESCALNLA